VSPAKIFIGAEEDIRRWWRLPVSVPVITCSRAPSILTRPKQRHIRGFRSRSRLQVRAISTRPRHSSVTNARRHCVRVVRRINPRRAIVELREHGAPAVVAFALTNLEEKIYGVCACRDRATGWRLADNVFCRKPSACRPGCLHPVRSSKRLDRARVAGIDLVYAQDLPDRASTISSVSAAI